MRIAVNQAYENTSTRTVTIDVHAKTRDGRCDVAAHVYEVKGAPGRCVAEVRVIDRDAGGNRPTGKFDFSFPVPAGATYQINVNAGVVEASTHSW